MRDLAALPKGHLHLHLEGAMRPATLHELCERYGMEVPVIRGFGSFAAFDSTYVAACEVLKTHDDLVRVVHEVVEDAHAAGAVYLEPSYLPVHHRGRLGPDAETLDVVLEAGRSRAAELGLGFGLMLVADRTQDPAQGVEQAAHAVRLADRGVVSFSLVNAEAGFPPEPHRQAFDMIREAGLISAPHAGEHDGPASVRGALDTLGARRIAHGVRAAEDPALVSRLADEAVCLDVCPSSNLALGVYGSLDEHPLPGLLAAGVRVSLGGDDPLLFGPGLLEEYELARAQLGLDDATLAFIARCSLEDSGAEPDVVARGVAGIDAWLAAPA
ncbi:adenosine deaminase [Rhodococcus aerolatus]